MPFEESYVILTPVHNEAENIRRILDSVIGQTVKARQWVIIDDCSTDETPEIIKSYQITYPWIILADSKLQCGRERGGHIAKVVLEGKRSLSVGYDFIVKLDGDLSLPQNYFELILRKFDENPKLGIAGGVIYVPDPAKPKFNPIYMLSQSFLAKSQISRGKDSEGNGWRLEVAPEDHVRGATKVYRRACYEAIGGIEPVNGWDGIDEWRAQLLGWETRSFSDIHLRQHRPTGGVERGLKAHTMGGEFAYFLGYPWLFILARSFYRSFREKPYIISGLAQFGGYLSSWIKQKERFDDPVLLDYIRRKQLKRLFFWQKFTKYRRLG